MTRDFLGRGIAFPVRPAVHGGLVMAEDEAKVRQAILLILSTAPGERVMRPDFGCGIHDLVFSPNTSAVRNLIDVKVREALIRWERRIDVIDVGVSSSPERRNQLLIDIKYRIRVNNAVQNLVYPFFLHEQQGR